MKEFIDFVQDSDFKHVKLQENVFLRYMIRMVTQNTGFLRFYHFLFVHETLP